MSVENKDKKNKYFKWVHDFESFIMRGNVVDLAVGIIVGAAFTSVVKSLVNDIFNPIIGLFLGGVDFSNFFITLKGPHVKTLAEAQRLGAVTINFGLFLNTIIQFLIIGFVVFLIVRVLNDIYARIKVQQQAKEEAKAAQPSKQEILLQEIRDILAKKNAS